MIPPLNVQIRSRGVCPVLVSGGGGGGGGGGAVAVRSQGHHVEYEFGMEPETEATMAEAVFVEGAMANDQIVDCVRQMYLGKNPYSAKQCTRQVSLAVVLVYVPYDYCTCTYGRKKILIFILTLLFSSQMS